MANDLPEGVTVELTSDAVSASAEVAAPADEVFEFLRRPANHAIISGDGTVRGQIAGPERLHQGDRFGMDMKLGIPYRIRSRVVTLEEGRRIAWAHVGRHQWRWDVEPLGEDRCRVTETFDLSTAIFPPALRLVGYPKRHTANVAQSVANVVAHFATDR